jgi:hypothetical protein
MSPVMSCEKTSPRVVGRKDPSAIRNRKSISVATHSGFTNLSRNQTKYPTGLTFAEDFLLEHSASVAKGANSKSAVCAGPLTPERSVASEFCGSCF